MPTIKAQHDCKEWLKSCLDFGWDASTLGELERLWWKYHDEHGNLVSVATANKGDKP